MDKNNIFVSHEEELKKLYTLIRSNGDDIDRQYLCEKILRMINRVPLVLHPNLEEVFMNQWRRENSDEYIIVPTNFCRIGR